MTITVQALDSLNEIDPGEYRAFFLQSRAPLFYDQRFMLAAEQSPLLPVHRTLYFLVRRKGRLVAFMPAYLQDLGAVDPLGVLAHSVGLQNDGADRGLFSHVMHCFDSTIPALSPTPEVYGALLDAMADVARAERARYFGLLNLPDGPALREAARAGLRVSHMVDRYAADLSAFPDFDSFVSALPADGRHEMTRQLRKFQSSGASARVIAPPFGDKLDQLAALCQQTTARNGTPHYFPAEPLARFSRLCGDLIRLSVVEVEDRLVSGFICFEEAGTFHLWSAGMTYDETPFSPYTIGVAAACRHAIEKGLRRLEGGRLHARIKTRLGLRPLRLYAATSEDRGKAAASARLPDAAQVLVRTLEGEVRFRDHPAYEEWLGAAAWNGRTFDRRPAAIVRAASEADVVRTIAFARETGLRISVRGGGHSYAGCFLRSDTLMLDVSALNQLDIDVARSRAIAGPGVQGAMLSTALASHGLAFPTGHGRNVAIGGFLLGGGLGINCAQWGGMSVFNVEALDIVDAQGRCRHVDAEHDPALFWAARGGGPGLFFVVTRFYLKCWPLPRAIRGSLYAADVSQLGAVLEEIERADPPRNLQVMVIVASDSASGNPVVLVNTLAFTGDLAEATRLRAGLTDRITTPLTALEVDQPSGFETIYQATDAMLVSRRYRTDNILTDRTQDIAPILSRHLPAKPSPASVMLLVWRGKDPSYPDAAYSARGRYFVSTYAQWNEASDDAVNRAWLNGMYDELAGIASGAYVNEFDLEHRSAEVGRCFGDENRQRLSELRRLHDANSLFVPVETLAQDVPPDVPL
ncbi:GNAT family N-acetyltransferase [Acidovorax cavernicola]|uniref:GNAT family N-acetyltransferase n=1 Tax=Acidovorax cavernicola TaxID=1675792 RepID=A0A9X8GTW4_9BURK|nr:GNAT family N-acetyltransferase [Acidovorax cavernicola]RIX77070.1 GNAT family N-acetyltransferase [Acidovorax cavernicola]